MSHYVKRVTKGIADKPYMNYFPWQLFTSIRNKIVVYPFYLLCTIITIYVVPNHTRLTGWDDLSLKDWGMCDSWNSSLVSNGCDWRQRWWRNTVRQNEVHVLSWALNDLYDTLFPRVNNLSSVSVYCSELRSFFRAHLNESFSRRLTL